MRVAQNRFLSGSGRAEQAPREMTVREAFRAGSQAALRKGQPLGVVIAGREVAIFEVCGEIVATAGKCPHAGGPLCEGTLTETVLTCPWHGWSYDLRTGACEEDPNLTLECYEVRLDGDDIFVVL